MKIQFASDLHLEFKDNQHYLLFNPIEKNADILILAGDIDNRPHRCIHNDSFFERVSTRFEKTYWLVGNHEFWNGRDYAKYDKGIMEDVLDNIYVVNNKSIVIDDVTIIFSTMWTKLDPTNWYELSEFHGDFDMVKYRGATINCRMYDLLHERCMTFITNELNNVKTKKCVVVTHHCPYADGNGPKYKTSKISSGFAVKLDKFIEDSGVDYWIHGHTHYNHPDLIIGKTNVVCNQLGYVKHNEKEGYLNNKTIEI